jgi:hypothetical protein
MHAPKPKGHPDNGHGLEPKNTPYSLGNKAEKSAIGDASESRPKAARLEWEQINSATWRLADPDGPKVETPRCHGHWPGFMTPKAVAWVFDVGVNGSHDWRVRVRTRGGWHSLGSVIDADLAKRLAESAVENSNTYKNPAPAVPLNLLGGDRRWPKNRNDITTRAKVIHTEVGGEILESAVIAPPPDDSESINTCASDTIGPTGRRPMGPRRDSHFVNRCEFLCRRQRPWRRRRLDRIGQTL